MILPILLAIFSISLELEPVADCVQLPRQVALGPEGLIFAATPHNLYGWNREGKLVHQVGGKFLNFIGAYYFDGEHFLVCDARGNGKSHVFDREGKHLFESDFYTFFFRDVDGELFGFPLFHKGEELLHQYPFQLQSLNYRVKKVGMEWAFAEPVFAKMTQFQLDLYYNFKRCWAARVGNTFYSVNEIEARIYHYDTDARTWDKNQGSTVATGAPFTSLKLVGFSPFHEWLRAPKGVHETSVMKKWYGKWWHSFSRLTGFYGFGDGFVISYEVPNGSEGERTGSRLYLQRLSLDFSPVGEPWRGEGMLMGVDGGQAVIFQPNPVLGDDGEPVSMKPTVQFVDLTKP